MFQVEAARRELEEGLKPEHFVFLRRKGAQKQGQAAQRRAACLEQHHQDEKSVMAGAEPTAQTPAGQGTWTAPNQATGRLTQPSGESTQAEHSCGVIELGSRSFNISPVRCRQ
jgi:hypothetical protein